MKELAKLLAGAERVVILGVGSDLKGDDIAGLLVARQLAEFSQPKLHVLIGGTAPENLTGEIKKLGPSHLVIVDAAEMKAEPGTVKLLTPEEIGGYSFSTHALPLKMMIEFVLQEHRCEVILVAIQPRDISFGAPVDPAVQQAATEIVANVKAAISS